MFRKVWVRYLFIVSIISLPLFGSVFFSAPPASAAAFTCTNLLQNSDMEGGTGWIFGRTPAQGGYSTTQSVSPIRSARLGITGPGNVKSFSSMRQLVSAPTGPMLQLRLQVLPLSQPYDGNDIQEILIMDTAGNTTLRTLWSATVATGVWQPLVFDITDFAGQDFMLYINVYNDGYGGRTAMYVDDVYLELCSSATVTATPTSGFVTATPTTGFVTATPTAGFVTATPTSIVVTNTPTATPTPNYVTATPTFIVVTNTPTSGPGFVTATPTPIVVTNTPTAGPGFVTATPTLIVVTNTPTPIPPGPYPTPTYTPVPPGPDGCIEMLLNTSFEDNQGWSFGKTRLQPGYVSENPHTGFRSVVMGTAGRPNSNSYSSTRQRVNLLWGSYTTAYLEFWHYTLSDMENDDYQELIILDARGNTERILWRVNRNDGQWLPETFNISRFLGQSIYVYFNVRNQGGGGSATMYVDDVSLQLCSGTATTLPSIQQTSPQAPTITPVTAPEFVLGTTSPSAPISDTLTAPEFSTAVPNLDQVTPPPSVSATEAADVEAPSAGQVTSTPAPETVILATPTPLGAEQIVPEKTTRSIGAILLRTLLFLAIVIGFVILIFLVYRVIMGRRNQPQ